MNHLTSSGLDPLECAVVSALWELCGPEVGMQVSSRKLLDRIEKQTGFGQSYIWRVATGISNPSRIWIPLAELSWTNSDDWYIDTTEIGLSETGRFLMSSDHGGRVILPLRIINGTIYKSGYEPPFDPQRVLDLMQRLLADPSLRDADIVAELGLPRFPNDCAVSDNGTVLSSNAPTKLELHARIDIVKGHPSDSLKVTGFPPPVRPQDLVMAASTYLPHRWPIDHRATSVLSRPPIAAVYDATSSSGIERVDLVLEPGADAGALRHELLSLDSDSTRWNFERFNGLRSFIDVWLPTPISTLIRAWLKSNNGRFLADDLHHFNRLVASTDHWRWSTLTPEA
jgi:hypothetical protein